MLKGKIAAFYGTKMVDADGREVAALRNGQEVKVTGEPVILLGKGEFVPVKADGKGGYVPVAQVHVNE